MQHQSKHNAARATTALAAKGHSAGRLRARLAQQEANESGKLKAE